MSFTEAQAKKRAKQIFEDLGQLIHDACVGTGIAESFLAGFTGVEAAFDNNGPKVSSKRFEKGVYADLISLRDNGYCWVGGSKHSTYNKVTRAMIHDANDDAVRNLATSWGCTQIMGYWGLVLGCTIAELRDPRKHFGYTIKLLKLVGGHYMRDGDLTAVLHIWNTGSANGKTYHEDYVDNALKVKKAYDALLKENPFKTSAAISPDRIEGALSDESNGTDIPSAVGAESPDSSQEMSPASTAEAPTAAANAGLWERLTSRFDTMGEKADKIEGYAARIPMSITSRLNVIGMKAIGFLLGLWGVLLDHPIYAALGTALIIAGAWYLSRSKDRNTLPAQTQNVAVAEVKS